MPQDPARAGITPRGIILGLVFTAVICFTVSYAELVIGRIQIGFLQMPPAVIGIFFFMVLLNRGMQRIRHAFALSSAELLMIYCMMLVAAMISSRGVMEKLIPLLVTPAYFANPANKWMDLYFPHIKKWMVAFDPQGGRGQAVATGFFERLRDGQEIPWTAWLTPLAMWGILVLLIVFAFMCLATILRRQWVDNEKLTFPLAQMPIDLVRETGGVPIWHNKLFWIGVAVPTIVFTQNGLHNVAPSVPEIPLSIFANDFFVNPPWDRIYATWLYLSFAGIGFFYFLPSELIFAIWFFAILARLQGVAAGAFGWEYERMPVYGTPQFVAYQTAGAYIVLAGYLTYTAWPHLRRVFRTAFGSEAADDSQELLPYRVAVWGLLISFALILGWGMMAGMSLWVALLEFGVFIFIIALVMARSTAEAGMLMTETSFRPVDLYRMFAPIHSLGAANITMLAFFDMAFLRDQRGLLFTGILDGLRIADGGRLNRRALLPAFGLAVLAALVLAGAIHLWIPYTKGGITLYQAVYNGHNVAPFREYQEHLTTVGRTTWDAPVFFAVGIVVTVLLSWMRAAFFWWPFHPLGYALCISWAVSVFWFSCLIAWIIKGLILRYGGMRYYSASRPFFVGMILGEFTMALAWTLINALTGATPPVFPWI